MDFAKLAERFEEKRVSFVSVTQHLNTADSLGRLSLNILLSFAQFERDVQPHEHRGVGGCRGQEHHEARQRRKARELRKIEPDPPDRRHRWRDLANHAAGSATAGVAANTRSKMWSTCFNWSPRSNARSMKRVL